MTGVRPGPIVLLGSGETAAIGGRVFESLGRALPHGFRATVLETPAGFELNSERVAARIAAFVQLRLNNYGAHVDITRGRRGVAALSPDDPNVTAPLLRADLIFAGPGSPTYAARQLAGSLAWDRIRARHALGAALVFASAAAIAVGRYVLPVYEIYKAGHDLYWQAGLDLFAPYGLKLAILSHWNNSEGGADLDTSRCFVGKERFDDLMQMLPSEVTVIGIDEHTAVTLDAAVGQAQVMGQGRITILRERRETSFGDGESFDLRVLGSFQRADLLAHLPQPVVDEALAVLDTPRDKAPEEVLGLASARQRARSARDWAAADQLRERIEALGWQVQDTPDGPALTPGANG